MISLGRPCFLYFSLSWHHFRPLVRALLDCRNILQTYIRGDKAIGFDPALDFIWILLWSAYSFDRPRWYWLDGILNRNINRACNCPCLQRSGRHFALPELLLWTLKGGTGSSYNRCRPRFGSGEPRILYDRRHSAMARCSPGLFRKYVDPRHRAVCSCVPELSQSVQDWYMVWFIVSH